jgi:peroxiredoxin
LGFVLGGQASRHLPLIVVLTAAISVGVGVLLWRWSSTPPAAQVATPALPAAPAPTPASPASAPARPRAGRVLTFEDAVRELDLIRPARLKAAEDFTVKLADGGSFRLSEQRGKAVLINFWATWCPPCLEEMPAMERLWRQHKDDGFVLLAVSVDAQPTVVTTFVRNHRLTFATGLDPKMDLANSYGVRALPSSFLIDRDGKLAALALGPRTWDGDAAHSLVERLRR